MTAESIPTWPQPSHPTLLKVIPGTRPFSSSAQSLTSLPAGTLLAKITTATSVSRDTYTSVGTGENTRIELNSDLVYCNHSCDPSLEFDMKKMEVRVARGRDLKEGDDLTFFYPSSEWRMVQPFECECGSGKCLGWIAGADDMKEAKLKDYWLNEHIEKLIFDKLVETSKTSVQVPVAGSEKIAVN